MQFMRRSRGGQRLGPAHLGKQDLAGNEIRFGNLGRDLNCAHEGKMDLEGWRARIDALNGKLVDILNERARCALGIAALKKERGMPVLDPVREREILANVERDNEGPLSHEALRRIFDSIMAEHRKLEEGT